MRGLKVAIIILTLIMLTLVVFFIMLNNKMNNIIVIDVIEVVNEFDMKKELDVKVEGKLQYYKGKMDSLNAVFENTKSENAKRSAQKLFQKVEADFNYAVELSNKNINEQVWKRLNPLIDEYGKEKGYRVIIGANGMGSVMYRDDAVDKTQELIKFINQKFRTGD